MGRIRKRRGGAILLVWAAAWVLSAASARAAELRVLTTAEGLPSNWVSSLAAAPDGKLWVGTNAGICLFDPGTGSVGRFGAQEGFGTEEPLAIALFRGKVYAGTASGIKVYDGAAWTSLGNVGNVTMRNVRLAASPDGKELWACSVTLAGGIVRFDGKEWKFMGGEGRGLFNDVLGIAFPSGGVLLGGQSGAAYLHKGTDVLPLREGLPAVNIFSAGAWNGKALLGTSGGLLAYDRAWTRVAVPPAAADAPVYSIAVRGETILAGTSRGLLSLAGKARKVLSAGDGLPAAEVTAVAVTGDLIAAGTPKGLVLIREW